MSTSSQFTGNVLAVGGAFLASTGPILVLPDNTTPAVKVNVTGGTLVNVTGGTFPPRNGFSQSAGTVQGGGPETNYSNKLGSMVTTNLRMVNTNFLYGINTGGEIAYNSNQSRGGSSDSSVFGFNNTRPNKAPGPEKRVEALTLLKVGSGYTAGEIVSTISNRQKVSPLVGIEDGGSGLTIRIKSTGVGGSIGEIEIVNPGQGYDINDKISAGTATMFVTQLVPAHIRISGSYIPDNTRYIHGNENYTFASFGNLIFPK
jgi:hypothetical protein